MFLPDALVPAVAAALLGIGHEYGRRCERRANARRQEELLRAAHLKPPSPIDAGPIGMPPPTSWNWPRPRPRS